MMQNKVLTYLHTCVLQLGSGTLAVPMMDIIIPDVGMLLLNFKVCLSDATKRFC